MAYAQDRALIKDIQTAAANLNIASRWASGKPVQVKDDFLFEMHLLFRVVGELSTNHSIEYVSGDGGKMHEFPRAPADKAGRPRFNIKNANTGKIQCQVCAGTKAKDRSGKERGLDLSIQTADASDKPGVQEVLQILDAKYRPDSTRRITHPEFASFAHWVESFELRTTETTGLDFGVLQDLDANCLVTNGKFSTEKDKERAHVNVREIARFYPTTKHERRPVA